MLNSYVQQIKNALSSYEWIESVEFVRLDMTETDQEAILLYRLRISLTSQAFLEVCERLCVNRLTKEVKRTKYHYHLQDNKNQLIRRWDNAPHHPEIATFPHHVHVGSEDICKPCRVYSLLDILEKIDRLHCNGEILHDG